MDVLRGNAEDRYSVQFFVVDILVTLKGRTKEEVEQMRIAIKA